MYRDNARTKSFTRRTALIGGGMLAMFGVLAARMYQLQVLESRRYKLLAEENRIHLRLLPPPRGRILDRHGELLAINRDNYRVFVVPEETPDVEATLDALARFIELPERDRKRVLREVRRNRGFVPVAVRENLTWEEVARIEVNAPDLPGLSIDVGQTREYPEGATAAHLLGYVAAVSEAEQTGEPMLNLPGFRIGKNGVEKVHDLPLRGKAGNSQLEVNAVGRVMRELARQEGQPGQDVALTLDMGLQRRAMERLAQEAAATAVVMDVNSGDVLVMASSPSYDPNAFARGLTPEEWGQLSTDERTPLINKAIAGLYAPGSTFKLAVALAALESGIGSDLRTFCRGQVDLGSARFHCWKKGGHGSLDMISGIEQSCDVYFYELARRVGVDRIAATSARLGLGRKVDIEVPGEKPGLVPTRAWKLAATGVPWQPGETLVTGIGQGFVLATPLQLAVMTARVANGGKAVVPRLYRDMVRGESSAPKPMPEWPSIGVSEAAIAVVQRGMWAVSNGTRGTARGARIAKEPFEMAGKTGTSQVRRITRRERETRVLKNEEKPWNERDHALFVGYVPAAQPRYAAAVVVEHGGGGAAVAAPIVRDLLLATQRADPSGRDRGPVVASERPGPRDEGPGGSRG
ncbi:MAG TPA: penicillin-binding protein 2 [Alphaproteobacteria bacterium]